MKQGKVWLVGAGPGDAGLLTCKAAEVLQSADVIIYDALVSLEILCLLPAHAEKIYVGKRAGQHTLPQEAINRLILQKAEEGLGVVRLKGGDPFVFGRGGEELELLTEHGIPYEVIPGITSAVAAPAYAGIPVTHRGCSSSFHVITGHTRKGNEERIDYAALARMNATLIFLMGVGQLPEISARLIEAGLPAQTPAAIIENGTMAFQRQLLSTLEKLPVEAANLQYQAPAVILIGQAAAFMTQFQWQQQLPMAGKQCIVTRPREKAPAMAQRLRSLGAHIIELPAIATHLLKQRQTAFEQGIQSISAEMFSESWIVLTSPTDVEMFFRMLAESPYDLRELRKVHWAVTGRKTAQTLRGYGLRADLIPREAGAESLAAALGQAAAKNAGVFVMKGNLGSSAVRDAMQQKGIYCEELIIYETRTGMDSAFADRVYEEACRPDTYLTFTSASCVDGFVQAVGQDRDFSAVQAVCIGPQTAKRALAYQMPVLTSEEPSIDGMLRLLENL